jgi:hypothetical protein
MSETGTAPKGRDVMAGFYSGFVAARLYFLEYDCERIIADEDCIVMEAIIKTIFPGSVLSGYPQGSLGKNPVSADMAIVPSRHCLLTGRNVTL